MIDKKQVIQDVTNLNDLLALMSTIHLYRPHVKDMQEKHQTVTAELEKMMKILQNQEAMNLRSPEEQKALMDNSRAYYQTSQQLVNASRTLNEQAHTFYVQSALYSLSMAVINGQTLLTRQLDAEMASKSKLKHLHAKGFKDLKYETQINNLYNEINHQLEAWLKHFDTITDPLCKLLIDSIVVDIFGCIAWLRREVERFKAEGVPKIQPIEIPDLKKPSALKVVKH